MDCPHCSQTIPDGSKFCGHCGKRLGNQAAPKQGAVKKSAPAQSATPAPDSPAARTAFMESLSNEAVRPAQPEPSAEAKRAALEEAERRAAEPQRKAAEPQRASLLDKPKEEPLPRHERPTEVEVPSSLMEARRAEPDSVVLASTEQRFLDREAAESAAPKSKDPESEIATARLKRPIEPKRAPVREVAPQAAPQAGGGDDQKKGGFRETMWFMDALDVDALSNIDDADMRIRGERFEDDGRKIDDDVRRQFSLSAEPAPRPTLMQMARLKIEGGDDDAAGGGALRLLLLLIILAGLGGGGWWFYTHMM